MTDRELVLQKLATLREHADRIRRRRTGDLRGFLADVDRQDALSMSLLVALQECVDIALHIAADEGWGTPASYAESFDVIARRGVVDGDLARKLAQITSVRNRIAHLYGTLDVERLWNEVPAGLAAFDAFAQAIARYIAPPAA